MNYLIISRREKKNNKHIAEKMRQVVNALEHAYEMFNGVAQKSTDRKTQILVFSLATESYQYYKELVSQVQVLECKPFLNEKGEETKIEWNVIAMQKERAKNNTDDILKDCTEIEKKVIKEYRGLLNDPYILGDHRKLLQQQLNGLLYAFVKLKMLKSFSSSSNTLEAGVLF